VFQEVSELVQSSLDGYHVCIMSYGQTGSGKTWNMSGTGTEEGRGLIPRAVEKLVGSVAVGDLALRDCYSAAGRVDTQSLP
jgi:hypothetical protein